MKYDKFIKEVQERAKLGSKEDALRATQATLETLGERLFGGEAKDLASQLPEGIGEMLLDVAGDQKFNLNEFYTRVSENEGVDIPVAAHHAHAVLSVVNDAVTPGEIEDVRSQLPAEFHQLFEGE